MPSVFETFASFTPQVRSPAGPHAASGLLHEFLSSKTVSGMGAFGCFKEEGSEEGWMWLNDAPNANLRNKDSPLWMRPSPELPEHKYVL